MYIFILLFNTPFNFQKCPINYRITQLLVNDLN